MATLVVVTLPPAKRLRRPGPKPLSELPFPSKAKSQPKLLYKHRKIDVNPLDLNCDGPLVALYRDLLQLEEQLDSDLKAQRRWIQALLVQSPALLQATLRVHIYNTHFVEQGMVGWKLRIQGRLIHPALPRFYRSQDQVEQRYTKKFNWFFRRIQVKLENGEVMEWRKEIYKKESDGIEINRKKESAGEVQISFFLDSCKFQLSPALSSFLGVAEETKVH